MWSFGLNAFELWLATNNETMNYRIDHKRFYKHVEWVYSHCSKNQTSCLDQLNPDFNQTNVILIGSVCTCMTLVCTVFYNEFG